MKTILCNPDHSIFLDSFIHFLQSDLSPETDLPIVLRYYSEELLPPSFIYYNTEQLTSKKNSRKLNYMINYIKKHNVKEVWDYSKINVELFKQHSIEAKYVPLQTPKWYSDKLQQFRNNQIQYDVGFCGCISPRREKIYKKLIEKGIKLKVIANLFGDERDRELERQRTSIV
jgi:hypothetical protein